jgi:hypothetical protein
MKLCPSQTEEMSQIGALCCGNLFMYCEDLKAAIINHPLWLPKDPNIPPILDLFISDFISPNKKTKMIFISTEQSHVNEMTDLFK